MEIIKLGFVFILAEVFIIEFIKVFMGYMDIDRCLKNYLDKKVIDNASGIKYLVDDYCFNLVGDQILKITHDNVLYIYVHPAEVRIFEERLLIEGSTQ